MVRLNDHPDMIIGIAVYHGCKTATPDLVLGEGGSGRGECGES